MQFLTGDFCTRNPTDCLYFGQTWKLKRTCIKKIFQQHSVAVSEGSKYPGAMGAGSIYGVKPGSGRLFLRIFSRCGLYSCYAVTLYGKQNYSDEQILKILKTGVSGVKRGSRPPKTGVWGSTLTRPPVTLLKVLFWCFEDYTERIISFC